MKKLVMTAAVVACAGIVSAQVYSANIVGYSKESAPAGLRISGFQFGSGATTLADVYGDQYPEGTQVFTYIPGTGYGPIANYESFFDLDTFTQVTNWNPKTISVSPGEGYWLNNASGSAQEAIVSGEVPLDDAITNSIVAGLQLISYPYPVEVAVVDAGFDAVEGDQIFTYIPGDGYGTIVNYESYFDLDTFTQVTNWNPKTATLPIGEGVWYNSVGAQTWTATRPFTP